MATKQPDNSVDVDNGEQLAEPEHEHTVVDEQHDGDDDVADQADATNRPEPLLTRDGSPAAALWSLNSRWRHINHGSFGAVPVFAQLRRLAYLQETESAPQRWFMAAPERLAQAREGLADFLGVDADRFGFVPNASAGMTAAIRALMLNVGDELLITDHAYGAVAFSARREARQRGAKVRTVPIELDATPEHILTVLGKALAKKPAGLIIDASTSSTAREFPVVALAELATKHGVPLLVDAAHAPGIQHRPAEGIAASAWVGNLHKFACGFRGSAVLVAEKKFAKNLYPIIDSWGMDEPFPGRFDHQGTFDYTPYLASVDAITGLEDRIGWDSIRGYIESLLDYSTDVVADALDAASGEESRVDVAAPAPGMTLLRLPGTLGASHDDAQAVRQRITDELGFETQVTSFRDTGYLRLSAHAYNTADDYERFAEDAVPTLVEWSRER
ncbi:aminotransferase class V-fold PLP-dependent enzyme [Salinibacterium sp. SWN248]|uniref:aminotransferase class V-fold PLP-dependent enzyme n=1 Tax=Salinibacterium sp. SWN248 TaxID=2792056 RepID=UPI0018CD8F7D|nr:aminotransferase class V-fold PLP-dependent enzyme [Salinibacterium sp. SWN248]MBH0023052.1 aminotransferase class V-fold PLP-dependent enzyme [Salinibacterium sp. SWN248]